MEGEYLSIETAKKIAELEKEIERLNNIIIDINRILYDDDFSHIEKLQEIHKLVGSDKE